MFHLQIGHCRDVAVHHLPCHFEKKLIKAGEEAVYRFTVNPQRDLSYRDAEGNLVLEAGGLITDLKGGEDWFSGSICCGNPKIFGQLLPLVGDFEKKADADETAEAAEGAAAPAAEEKKSK